MYRLPPKRPQIETEPGVNSNVIKIIALCFTLGLLLIAIALCFA